MFPIAQTFDQWGLVATMPPSFICPNGIHKFPHMDIRRPAVKRVLYVAMYRTLQIQIHNVPIRIISNSKDSKSPLLNKYLSSTPVQDVEERMAVMVAYVAIHPNT